MRPDQDRGSSAQRSVWDFPRPAIAEPCNSHIRIEHHGIVIAATRRSVCTFETAIRQITTSADAIIVGKNPQRR